MVEDGPEKGYLNDTVYTVRFWEICLFTFLLRVGCDEIYTTINMKLLQAVG